jgi:hypothetical protein
LSGTRIIAGFSEEIHWIERRVTMSKKCEPYEETHRIVVSRGVGCTKEQAKLAIFDDLLTKAEKEREVKCEDLECGGIEGGKCVTTIDPEDIERLEKQIRYYLIRRKDCPRNLGWLARLVADPPRYRSECICVPSDD